MKMKFLVRYKFVPPARGTEVVSYEALIGVIEDHRLLDVEGDVVEIGAFLGGGTYKLSRYLERKKSQKRIYAIDIFDISVDKTKNTRNRVMADLYANMLRERNQWDVFCATTRGCQNVVAIKGDSKKIILPVQKICFAFIDGNHDPTYVENDFYLIWPRLCSGGVVAFDDYDYDLPNVTKTIDKLLMKHKREIVNRWQEGKIIYIKRGS